MTDQIWPSIVSLAGSCRVDLFGAPVYPGIKSFVELNSSIFRAFWLSKQAIMIGSLRVWIKNKLSAVFRNCHIYKWRNVTTHFVKLEDEQKEPNQTTFRFTAWYNLTFDQFGRRTILPLWKRMSFHLVRVVKSSIKQLLQYFAHSSRKLAHICVSVSSCLRSTFPFL